MNKEALIKVDNLYKTFNDAENKLDVLSGVNIDVKKKEILAIVGESGVGKSTLLHILGTLDHPTSGRVLFEEEDIFSKSSKELAAFRNKTIGFIFQFHYLMPEFNALENVMMPLLIAGKEKKEAKNKALFLLDEVGLSKRISHKPGELSGGEQQRVAIARSLVNNPKLVLADEPTGNLDSHNGKIIFDLLKKLNQERSITFILVTHNAQLVERSDRAVRLIDGKNFDDRV